MGPVRPPGALHGQLETLADALGGEWFLLERSLAGVAVIGMTEGIDDWVTPPDAATLLAHAERDGVIARLGLGRRSHPAGRGLGPYDRDPAEPRSELVERILGGVGIEGPGLDSRSAALLHVVLGGLSAAADAAEQAEHDRLRTERLELRAATDPLTGLLNRRGWDRLLVVEGERCARHRLDADVVVIDLDGLKAVNDTEGHEAGDAVIVRAATFIFSAVRIHDAVARLGGDEFAVLAVGTAGSSQLASRIEAALDEASVAASVGSARLSEAGTLGDAWRAADLRMYRIKQRRRRRQPRGALLP